VRKLKYSAVVAISTAFCLLPASASATGLRTAYCASTGDYCYDAGYPNGHVRLRFSTFSFTDPVKVCVRHGTHKDCRRIDQRPEGHGLTGFSIRWSNWFPNRGHGLYKVKFLSAFGSLGPRVYFRR
jgi:hypothetical protein